jgi:hypothetical protein
MCHLHHHEKRFALSSTGGCSYVQAAPQHEEEAGLLRHPLWSVWDLYCKRFTRSSSHSRKHTFFIHSQHPETSERKQNLSSHPRPSVEESSVPKVPGAWCIGRRFAVGRRQSTAAAADWG